MGFQVNCDRCGRFMKTARADELKALSKVEPICKTCLDVEAKLQLKVDTLQRKAEVDIKKVVGAYKTMISEEIHKVVEESYGDTDSL